MTDLSPQAQAVWDAFDQDAQEIEAVAAVLRAAADQVVPEQPHEDTFEYCCDYAQSRVKVAIRAELLAIAAELEGTNG